MALRTYNPNITTPRDNGKPSWENTKHNASTRTYTGEVIQGVSSKENTHFAPSCAGGDTSTITPLDHELSYHQDQVTKPLGTSLGSSGKTTSWNRHISLPSAQSLQSISRYESQASVSNQEKFLYGKAFTENSPETKSISTQRTVSSFPFGRIPPYNRNSFQQAFTEGGNYRSQRFASEPFRMETLIPSGNFNFAKKSEEETNQQLLAVDSNKQNISKTTGFAKYVEAARSSITTISSTNVSIPTFKIYEDHVNEPTDSEHTNIRSSGQPKAVQSDVRNVHILSNISDKRSAHEAEVLLREMIVTYKAGVHDVQPDGGLYNRYVGRYTIVVKTICTEMSLKLDFFSTA
jgi:hypothetical protein